MIEAERVARKQRPGTLPKEVRLKRWLPLKLKFEIWGMPCAICGTDYDICVDHILPLSKGGAHDRGNLQPLCEPCNLKKGYRLTNDELKAWYVANKTAIDANRAWRKRNRWTNAYDRAL